MENINQYLQIMSASILWEQVFKSAKTIPESLEEVKKEKTGVTWRLAMDHLIDYSNSIVEINEQISKRVEGINYHINNKCRMEALCQLNSLSNFTDEKVSKIMELQFQLEKLANESEEIIVGLALKKIATVAEKSAKGMRHYSQEVTRITSEAQKKEPALI